MDEALTIADLDGECIELLPDRDTLCQWTTINVTNVIGINLAIAINAASFQADAGALANQVIVVLGT
jgi:hypothetical protein